MSPERQLEARLSVLRGLVEDLGRRTEQARAEGDRGAFEAARRAAEKLAADLAGEADPRLDGVRGEAERLAGEFWPGEGGHR